MYESTFTFKTRRRIFLLTWILLWVNAQSMPTQSMPFQCPELCECYSKDNGLQSANCTAFSSDKNSFPNIHVLTIKPAKPNAECYIPKKLGVIFPQLYFLYLRNCSLTNISDYTFSQLTLLEEVDLSNNRIKKLDPLIFIHNKLLSFVKIQNNPLHIVDSPFIVSKSLWEIDLNSCGIEELTTNMFKNLTQLKYLRLENNKLKTINENVFPGSLKFINLSKNNLRNVPITELATLKHLKEIDLSHNPINCTCSLMDFQKLISKKKVVLANGIECAYPREFSGRNLLDISQDDLCNSEVEGFLTELCNDEMCSNHVVSLEQGYIADSLKKRGAVLDEFERDGVVPVDKKELPLEQMQNDPANSEFNEGSGDGTDIPEIKPVEDKKSSNVTEPILEVTSEKTIIVSSPVPENKTNLTEQLEVVSDKGISLNVTTENIKGNETAVVFANSENETNKLSPNLTETRTEINNPSIIQTETKTEINEPSPNQTETKTEINEPSPNPTETKTEINEPSPNPKETGIETEINEPSPNPKETGIETEIEDNKLQPIVETDTIKPSSENKSNEVNIQQIQAGFTSPQNSHSDSSAFNPGYLIPCLAILIVIIICLGVYLGQRTSQKKNWDPNDATNDGTEMQDNLLSDTTAAVIVNHSNKYSSEGETEQTERLMTEGEPASPKPIENGNTRHSNGNTLLNGEADNEPIECAIAKVTTLPDSIPKTPIVIQNK